MCNKCFFVLKQETVPLEYCSVSCLCKYFTVLNKAHCAKIQNVLYSANILTVIVFILSVIDFEHGLHDGICVKVNTLTFRGVFMCLYLHEMLLSTHEK